MGRGLGTLQRRLVEHLHTPEPSEFTTTKLAQALLGRTDQEAIRQVRRAVDGLTKRCLVTTRTSNANLWQDGRGRDEEDEALVRSYLRPLKYWMPWCTNDVDGNCAHCALGDQPLVVSDGGSEDGRKYHSRKAIVAYKSRVRWVSFAWTARSVPERIALLDLWISENSINPEPPDAPGVAGFAHGMWKRRMESVARWTDERAALTASVSETLGEPTVVP